MDVPSARRWSTWAAPAALFALNVLFRVPLLLNAREINSDAAVVALQAQHMLRGEWAPFLWGVAYQAAADPLMLAAGFAVAGPAPWVVVAMTLVGHLLLVGFAYLIARRHLGDRAAFGVALAVTFTPMAVTYVFLYATRQWCLTVLFAALWFFDGAPQAKRPGLRYAFGSLLGMVAVGMDQFALVLLPAVGLFGLLTLFDSHPGWAARGKRAAAALGGVAVGAVPFWLLRRAAHGSGAPHLKFTHIPANWRVLNESCLPWTLAYRIFIPGPNAYPDPWDAPAAFHVVQVGGAVLFGAAVAFGLFAVVARRGPWGARRLALFALVAMTTTVAGFLLLTWNLDMWHARYLAPLIWMAPFAFAPAAALLGWRRFGIALSPYFLSAAVGGWLSYGSDVRGPLPAVTEEGRGTAEHQLRGWLLSHGIHRALATYWHSYRLTYLFEEDPLVVPLNVWEDRYPPYRREVAQNPKEVLILHAKDSQPSTSGFEQYLKSRGQAFQRTDVASYSVFVIGGT